MRPYIPPHYKTVTTQHLTYDLRHDPRLTTHLGWNYPSQNHPGKSCEIKLSSPKLTSTKFAADFIEKDADWMSNAKGWSQCVREGEDEFEFIVQHQPETVSISMRRNDFYDANICEN